jgi:hypothetical protein
MRALWVMILILLAGCAEAQAQPRPPATYQSDPADRTGWDTCFPGDCWTLPAPV